jgi:hypothetical protein
MSIEPPSNRRQLDEFLLSAVLSGAANYGAGFPALVAIEQLKFPPALVFIAILVPNVTVLSVLWRRRWYAAAVGIPVGFLCAASVWAVHLAGRM